MLPIYRKFFQELVEAEQTHMDGRTISLSPAEKLPDLAIDKVRLGQIMHNLLDNASKYSPPRSEIRVSLSARGDEVLIGVTDAGSGIRKEDRSKIFQRFERLDKGSTSKPGLGLGLLVCRHLVEAHGGRIWVESRPGQGTTFWFTLPVPFVW